MTERRRTAIVRALALLMWGCACALLAGCGGSSSAATGTATEQAGATGAATIAGVGSPAPHPELGPFGGYVWTGPVRSAHADWVVPRVLGRSPRGEAATWIAAEAPGASDRAPFVQVGVNEDNLDHRGDASCYAFYSTARLGFAPVHLFGVRPGDVISASLRRDRTRWQITIADGSTGTRRTVIARVGAGRFNEAEYDQEDVTDVRTHRPFPYPRLSVVRFTAMSVDDQPASPARLSSSWLTDSSGYLAPTAVAAGGFALQHTTLSTAGARYLALIDAQDAATDRSVQALAHWVSGGAPGPAGTIARHYARVTRATIAVLGETRWPAPARAAITAMRSDGQRLVALLAAVPRLASERRPVWAARFDRLVSALGMAGHAARQALHLPTHTVTAPAG